MNYIRIYDQIIENAKTRIVSNDQYFEKHHIIPKCFGGSNESSNIAKLTAREHFICHWLLVKIHPNHKGLGYAFRAMGFFYNKTSTVNRKYLLSNKSRLYELLKIRNSKLLSGTGNPNYGKKFSDDHRKKLSLNSGMRKFGHSFETRKKISEASKDKIKSDETKMKMKLVAQNRPKVECPHCKIVGTVNLLKRYHFDNCKILNNI